MNMKTISFSVLATLIAAASAQAMAAPVEIKVWRHDTNEKEIAASKAAVERFNKSQNDYKVVMELIPEGAYTETINAAALAGKLPCALDMDQPVVPNFAWAGNLVELNGLLPAVQLEQLNSVGKGTYKGKVYSVGQYDVSLSLFSRKSVLEKNGIRIATLDQPYTLEEFNQILEKLKQSGEFRYPFDINTSWSGEWYSYGFAPFLQSFGGDEINRANYVESEGVLNGEKAVAFGNWMQSLVKNKYIDRKPTDDKGFLQGKVAIHYNGSWAVGDMTKAYGDDLAIMPVPDFGHGPVIGGGSWHWGISKACPDKAGAAKWLSFLMQPEEIAAMSNATSLIPNTAAAAAMTENYKAGGKWRVFYEFSEKFAKMRPETPAYPVITSSFEKAMNDILDGGDVQDALDKAVEAIERNIEDNSGYGFKK